MLDETTAIRLARRLIPLSWLLFGLLGLAQPVRAEPALVVESRIALPGVTGRIDHMAVDLGRKRLFIAEIGNGSLDVVDLRGGRQIQRITGLAEPQGVGYAPKADLVAVANGGDGSVRFFRGGALTPEGAVALASDADDVRVDPRTGDIVVGYGSGGLAVVDPDKRSKIGDVRLAAHPEGFAVDPATGRAYVNVPGAGQIAVVDLVSGRQVATWAVPDLRANFPIALDAAGTIVATVFRHPPKLVLVDARTGAATARLDACGDADDVFFDAKRARIYVVCGAGIVDVFAAAPSGAYARLARVETAAGARTALFVPQLDRLFVAARAGSFGTDAAVIVFRPMP
jgi:DNA-binding beta-propeller fold protein YncE